jgi:hypothetical protein
MFWESVSTGLRIRVEKQSVAKQKTKTTAKTKTKKTQLGGGAIQEPGAPTSWR